MCRPIFGSGKAIVLDSRFFVAKGITEIKSKGVYVADMIDNWCYWTKVVPGDLIGAYFEDK